MHVFLRTKITIVLLLIFSQGYAQGSTRSGMNYTGTYQLVSRYRSDMGKIEIEQIAPDTLKFYLNVIRTSEGHIAETYGTFVLEGNEGIFHNRVYGAENCTLTFYFKGDTLYLNQEGRNSDCSFGMNAGVGGKYRKISASKPLFMDLKRMEARSKKLNMEYKRDRLARDRIADQYKSHSVKISLGKEKDDSSCMAGIPSYDRFLRHWFRDSLRLNSVARGIWYTQKKIPREDIVKSRKAFANHEDFISFPRYWVALSNDHTDSTCLHLAEGTANSCIEITDTTMIINGPKHTHAWYMANVILTSDGRYIFSCLGWPGIKTDSVIMYIMSPNTGLARVSYITHLNNERISYQWYMVPVERIAEYPICASTEEGEGRLGHYTESKIEKRQVPEIKHPDFRRRMAGYLAYQSKIKKSFLDSSRQREDERQLRIEAFSLTIRKELNTLTMLKNNPDFQAFNKEWMGVYREDTGYVFYPGDFVPNIQITGNKMIINTPEKTYAHFIKSFYKVSPGLFRLNTFYPEKDSLDTFIFKNTDQEKGIMEVDFNLPSVTGARSYSWEMAPLKNMLLFPFRE